MKFYNILKALSLICLSLITFSCETNPNKSIGATDSSSKKILAVSPVPGDTIAHGTLADPKVRIDLKEVKLIEIVSIKKEVSPGYTNESDGNCTNWRLSATQLKEILRNFVTMSGEEQDLAYDSYPCRMTGEIKLDQTSYEFWVGAGSTLTLKKSGTTYYFGL